MLISSAFFSMKVVMTTIDTDDDDDGDGDGDDVFYVKETTLMMFFVNIIYYMIDDMIRSDKI
jgi:hypothetical protein